MLRREASVIQLTNHDVLDFTVARQQIGFRKQMQSSVDNSVMQDSFELTQTRKVEKTGRRFERKPSGHGA